MSGSPMRLERMLVPVTALVSAIDDQGWCADLPDEVVRGKGKLQPLRLDPELFSHPMATFRAMAFSDCAQSDARPPSSLCMVGNNAGLLMACLLRHSG